MAIDRKRDALIVVDLQPDFMPGGPLAVAEGDRIAAPIGAPRQPFLDGGCDPGLASGRARVVRRARRSLAAALRGGERRGRGARGAAGRVGYVKTTQRYRARRRLLQRLSR